MTHAPSPASVDPAAFVAGLIGLPYRKEAAGPDAFDCWNLFATVRRELMGEDTPFSADLLNGRDGPAGIMHAIRTHELHRYWQPVEMPRHGDLVLLGRRRAQGHVGTWIDLGPGLVGILHCVDGPGGQVTLETVAQIRSDFPMITFYRNVEGAVKRLEEADHALLSHVAAAPVAIIVHDILNPLEGAEVVELEIGTAAGDVLDGLEDAEARWLVLGDMPLLRRHPATGVNEFERPLEQGDLLWVLPPLPLGGEQGNSQVLAALMAVVITIAAPWAAAIIAPGLAATSLGFKLLTAGIAIAGNALVQSLVPKTPPPATLANPDPTYSFSGIGNQMRPGAMIPEQFGTMHYNPDLLAPIWAEFDGDDQLVHILFALGEGEHRLNEFGTDDTTVWTSENGYTGAVPDIEHQLILPGETPTLFPTAVEVSSEVDGMELSEPDQGAEVVVGPFTAVSSGRVASEIVADFVFPRGLFEFNGGQSATSVTWEIRAQLVNDDGQVLGFQQVLDTITYSAASTTAQRLTKRYPVATGRYVVSAVRTSASTLVGNGAQDQLVWAGLRAKLVSEVNTFPDVTALAIRLKAGATSQRGLTNWYVKSTAVLPHIDTDTGKIVTGPTEQIDAAILKIARQNYGLNFDDADIDLLKLTELARTWKARGDVCCTRIESEMTAWDALTLVISAGRTRPSFVGTMLTFMRDEKRLAPTRLVTPGDMVRGSFQVERLHFRRDTPTVIRFVYRDREGRMRSMLIPPDGSPIGAAEFRSQVHVDPEQVWRDGSFMRAETLSRRKFVSWTQLASGRSLVPGQLVRVSHPRPKYGTPARVVSRDGLRLEMSAPTGLSEGETGWLNLAMPDGALWGPVACVGDGGHAVQIDPNDFDRILDLGIANRRYSADFREWIITEWSPASAPHGAVITSKRGTQAEATRASIGTATNAPLDVLIVGLTPSGDRMVDVLAAVEDNSIHDADTAPMPVQTDVGEALSNAIAPAWEGVDISGTIDTLADPDVANFTVTGAPVPGAVAYLVEVSVANVPPEFTRVATSNSPTISEPSGLVDEALIRVAAAGPFLRGPWRVYRTNFANAVGGVTTAEFQYEEEQS